MDLHQAVRLAAEAVDTRIDFCRPALRAKATKLSTIRCRSGERQFKAIKRLAHGNQLCSARSRATIRVIAILNVIGAFRTAFEEIWLVRDVYKSY
jgi:hypothetical protein